MRRALLATPLALLLLAGLPGSALAAPGSAIDEYQEHVPGGGRDRPSDEIGSGSGSGPSTLPPGALQALQAEGADGAAAARLAEATGPDAGRDGDGANGAQSASGSEDDAGGAIGEVLDQLFGGGAGEAGEDGMGILLPLILGLSALAALVFVLMRRRGETEGV